MHSGASRTVCFWPGLAGAWHRGNTTGLAYALLATWMLSLLLLATFVWPQWMPTLLTRTLWLVAFVAWAGSAAVNNWQFSRMLQVRKPLEPDDIFLQAQVDYLSGNWFEAEAKLLEILKDYPRDAETQLLLAGVLRRTRRYRPALRRLAQLESLDSSAMWHFEIARERELIEQRLQESSEVEEEPSSKVDSTTPSETLSIASQPET